MVLNNCNSCDWLKHKLSTSSGQMSTVQYLLIIIKYLNLWFVKDAILIGKKMYIITLSREIRNDH